MPRIVACGSRDDAFSSFCTAVKNGEAAMLLVDSEAPVSAGAQPTSNAQVVVGVPPLTGANWLPWLHLHQRDNWTKPANSADTDCHLMTQVMESWFLADRTVLQSYFGQKFQSNQLPAAANPVEGILKTQVYSALSKATHSCKPKGQYGKGAHSFELLALVEPGKVTAACPWALRFVEQMKIAMGV